MDYTISRHGGRRLPRIWHVAASLMLPQSHIVVVRGHNESNLALLEAREKSYG